MNKIFIYLIVSIIVLSIILILPGNNSINLDDDSNSVLGNLEPIEHYQQLFNVKWKYELTKSDIDFLENSLQTEHGFVADEALEAITVHRLFDFSDSLINPNKKHIINQEFVDILQSAKSENKVSVGNYLANKMVALNAKKEAHFHSHGRKSTLEIIESALFTSQCKAYRIGESYDFETKSYNKLYNILLEYSRMPNNQSIKFLLDEISNTAEVTDLQRNQVEVLRTYGYQPVNEIIKLIAEKKFENETTEHGRFLIFRFLTDQFVLLTDKDKEKLREILNNSSYSNSYLSSPKSLKILARLMRERLSPENYKQGEKKEIKPDKPHNQSELDSIKSAIEKEPHKKKFSRPEDRGQSFKNLSKDILLSKLSTTVDKIEQRKAAIEIGNRHIDERLTLTPKDQEIINDAVQRYIDTASDSNAQTREEGKLQIHRLWQVCIPKLIENLHNKDVAKLELAAKSLVLMQNEKAINGIVEKMQTAPNATIKNRLLFVMTMIPERRKTLISNRVRITDKESNALFESLVKPKLEKHFKK